MEAEEFIRQLRDTDPDLFAHIQNMRDGVRSARIFKNPGAIITCKASIYRQLYLVDQHGEVISSDIPNILGILQCEPETPAAVIPTDHNQIVHKIQKKFSAEVEARLAEQKHALSLTRAKTMFFVNCVSSMVKVIVMTRKPKSKL